MTYSYAAEKPRLFEEDNQKMFLSVRDRVHRLITQSGAVTLEKAIEKETGSSWTMIACVDRLLELGEIIELRYPEGTFAWSQWRVFTRPIHADGQP